MIDDKRIDSAPAYEHTLPGGCVHNVKVIVDTAPDGHLYAAAFSSDPAGGGYHENYALVSVRVPDASLLSSEACIAVDTGVLGDGFPQWMEHNGLGCLTGKSIKVGDREFPEFEFSCI